LTPFKRAMRKGKRRLTAETPPKRPLKRGRGDGKQGAGGICEV